MFSIFLCCVLDYCLIDTEKKRIKKLKAKVAKAEAAISKPKPKSGKLFKSPFD